MQRPHTNQYNSLIRAVGYARGGKAECIDECMHLLDEMEAFLTQAIGLDGLPVVIMVAQISSIDQLRLALPSYNELVRSYGLGAQTEAHISSLESQIIRSS